MTGFRLGIDLGTSAVKAVALDPTGQPIATGEAAFPTRSDLPGQAEQETGHWLAAAAAAVAAIGHSLGTGWRERVSAIGLAGQLPTLVCMGDDGPLGPAITWTDGRADAWAGRRLDAERRDWLYRRTGMPIDGRYLAPMFRYHWQERGRPVRRILSAKDFLCHALTGRGVTDPSTAAGYGVYAFAEGNWDAALCALWDLDPALLPEVQSAHAVAGTLHAAGAELLGLREGIPVTVGAADSVAGALAMAGLEAGIACVAMGSSTIVMDTVTAPLLDGQRRYLLTPHAMDGWFGREMDLLATGTGFRWLTTIFGWTDEELLSRAAAAAPGADRLFFAPYLAGGEQGALWDPSLRGALHGLTLSHTASDIARAFFEGVLFEIRRCIDVLSETSPVRHVVLAGHATASREMLGMAADMLGRSVQAYEHRSPAALGAAQLTALAGSQAMTASPSSPPVLPGPNAAKYEEIYRRYTSLFPRAARPPDAD
ncbi:MAG: FGGY-family carbohydrate kinase [Dongiaceae bacterium]